MKQAVTCKKRVSGKQAWCPRADSCPRHDTVLPSSWILGSACLTSGEVHCGVCDRFRLGLGVPSEGLFSFAREVRSMAALQSIVDATRLNAFLLPCSAHPLLHRPSHPCSETNPLSCSCELTISKNMRKTRSPTTTSTMQAMCGVAVLIEQPLSVIDHH